MSKARTNRTKPTLRQKTIFGGFEESRPDDDIQRDVMAAVESADYRHLPREIVAAFTPNAVGMNGVETYGTASFCLGTRMPKPVTYGDRDVCSMTEETFRKFTRIAMAAGFVAALQRYAAELKDVPELATWRRKRKHGGDKGREGGTRKRVDLAQRIRDKWAAMEAAGENPTNASVAAAIKQEYGRGSVRTVQRAFAERAETTTPVKRTKR